MVVLLQFVPPYASKGIDWSEAGRFTGEILASSIVYDFAVLYPVFKVIPVLLVICLVLLGNRVARIFNLYVGFTYVLFAILQNVAFTPRYGLGIITINVVMFLVVAAFWFWEALVGRNDFSSHKTPVWKFWVVPFAVMAFWYPADPVTLMPDFNPVYFLTNFAGLTFCMMTTVYLAILAIYHPHVNLATLRVTSIVGLVISFYNILANFVLSLQQLWWNGILHIPLLTLSAYGLLLSFRRRETGERSVVALGIVPHFRASFG